jgi:hypothetical protein
MRDLAPIGIAAALFGVALLIGLGIMSASGGSGTSGPKPPQHTATGNYVACPGGGQVQSAYTQMGDKFTVTGSLASKEAGGLLVRGPTGYIRMTMADQSRIEGPYASGEVVTVIGTLLADGTARANDVRPACQGAAVVAITPGPTLPVTTIEPTFTPAPRQPTFTPAPRPPAFTPAPPPPQTDEQRFVAEPDNDDGGEKHSNKPGRGHGRARGGGD